MLQAQAQSQVALRVRLSQTIWRELQARATARQVPLASYVDMVFRYSLHEGSARATAAPDAAIEESVYFEVVVPARTKHRLADRSALHQASLAAYGGLVLRDFVHRFARDPRDLATIHFLACRLDDTATVSDADLAAALMHCERPAGVRLPPGYLAKWLHQRLRTLVPAIRRADTVTELTLELLDEFLRQTERPAAARPQ